jgi:hypothetical protein
MFILYFLLIIVCFNVECSQKDKKEPLLIKCIKNNKNYLFFRGITDDRRNYYIDNCKKKIEKIIAIFELKIQNQKRLVFNQLYKTTPSMPSIPSIKGQKILKIFSEDFLNNFDGKNIEISNGNKINVTEINTQEGKNVFFIKKINPIASSYHHIKDEIRKIQKNAKYTEEKKKKRRNDLLKRIYSRRTFKEFCVNCSKNIQDAGFFLNKTTLTCK